MSRLERAFHVVRCDLADLGLLAPGRYLDHIDCALSPLPSCALGYVYDRVGLLGLLGFRAGVIYIRFNAPFDTHAPGFTLVDVIRHELAHAWAWYDRPFIDGPWFRKAFGARYDTEWSEAPEYDRRWFITDYATESPKEDFADTFAYYLKYRRSLERFRGRPASTRNSARCAAPLGRRRAREREAPGYPPEPGPRHSRLHRRESRHEVRAGRGPRGGGRSERARSRVA